jgi:hypothetical protein
LIFALPLALLAGSCIVDESGSSGGYVSDPYGCRSYTSCGTCTPVLGCGWCDFGRSGACVSDPDQCAVATSFSWTWESKGCPATPDAGAAADGGAD